MQDLKFLDTEKRCPSQQKAGLLDLVDNIYAWLIDLVEQKQNIPIGSVYCIPANFILINCELITKVFVVENVPVIRSFGAF